MKPAMLQQFCCAAMTLRFVCGTFAGMIILTASGAATASDHVGVYAVIEKVTIYKPGTPKETVKVEGLFSLSTGRSDYKTPVYGYMYFRLKEGSESICRKEWRDMGRVSEKPQVIAFSSRYKRRTRDPNNHGRVRRLSDKLAKPDEYTINYGVRKPSYGGSLYPPIRRLSHFTRPASPGDGSAVKPGEVKLSVHNVLEQDNPLKYFFEIEDASGAKESSEAIAQGKKATTWTPKMKIEAGSRYTWRAWVVSTLKDSKTGKEEERKGIVATFQFHGKK